MNLRWCKYSGLTPFLTTKTTGFTCGYYRLASSRPPRRRWFKFAATGFDPDSKPFSGCGSASSGGQSDVWIAAELQLGTWTHVSNLLSNPKQIKPNNQTELSLCQK